MWFLSPDGTLTHTCEEQPSATIITITYLPSRKKQTKLILDIPFH